MNEFIFKANQNVNFNITPEGYLDIEALVLTPGEYEVEGQTIKITKESLEASKETLNGKPITNEHPDEFVNASNNKYLSVGFAQDSKIDEGRLKTKTRITDAGIIDQIRTKEIKGVSAGFTADIDTNGVATNINFNHLAILVDFPRCEDAQLLFSKKNVFKGGNMKTKRKSLRKKMIFEDDNKELVAAVENVEDALDGVEEAAPNDNEVLKAKISELEAQIEALKAQIAELIGTNEEEVKDAYESCVEMGFSINFSKGNPKKQIENAKTNHLKEQAKKYGLKIDENKNYGLDFLKGFVFSKKEDKIPNASTMPAPNSISANFASEKGYKTFKIGSSLRGGN